MQSEGGVYCRDQRNDVKVYTEVESGAGIDRQLRFADSNSRSTLANSFLL